MYAIVEIAGKQYKVQENDKLFVPHLANAKVDDTIDFDRVLLVADGDDVRVGTPLVADALVSATVLEHVKADKILIFRKIRRKRFKVKKGHRQRYTQIEVGAVSLNGEKTKSASKKKSADTKAKPAAAEATEGGKAETKQAEAKSTAKETGEAEAKQAEAKSTAKETGKAEAKQTEAKSTSKETAKAEAKQAEAKSTTKETGKAEAKQTDAKSTAKGAGKAEAKQTKAEEATKSDTKKGGAAQAKKSAETTETKAAGKSAENDVRPESDAGPKPARSADESSDAGDAEDEKKS